MVYGESNAYVKGLNDFPQGETPPVFLTFTSFHLMVALGCYFIVITFIGVFLLYKKKLFSSKRYLKIMMFSAPLPLIACQLGWIAAEVGRQPWIVYGLLKTKDAVSITVPAEQVLISLILIGLIYLLLGSLYIYLLFKQIKRGPEPVQLEEVKA
jgi:cytochrome d ubiquinol oxidase subunit I